MQYDKYSLTILPCLSKKQADINCKHLSVRNFWDNCASFEAVWLTPINENAVELAKKFKREAVRVRLPSGYPQGKAGTDIPLIARIICVADSFDAMNTNRVYRKKLTMDDIIAEIENNKGKQFDPAIANVMLRLLREGKIQ